MASFQTQVMGLTSLSISSSGTNPTEAQLTQFLTDGAKEVINVLPADLIDLCSASQSFTSGTADTLNTGKVLRVFRSDGDIKQPCRKVDAMQKGRFSDNEDMNYATITDPVYYIENNSLDVLPVGGSATYSEVQYPAVAYSDTAIAVFPDEAEYLVPLYAAVKSLQNVLGNKSSNSDITTALGAMVTELNKADDIVSTASGKVDAFYISIGDIDDTTELWDDTNKRFTDVRDALLQAQNLIDNNEPHADYDAEANLADVDAAYAAMDAQLTDSEAVLGSNPGAGDIYTALSAMNSQADQSVQALANMGVEIGLANKEVDDALIEIDEAVGLVDNSSNIQVAVDAMKTANAKFRADASDPALFGDESTYTTGSSAMTNVKTHVDRAISYIDGNFPAAAYDLVANLADVDAELTSEDIELASSRMQQVQTTLNAVDADLKIAQTYITEWNTMVQTLVNEVNAFASEASARYGWIKAKADVWQGELSAAKGYMETANGYLSQASGFNSTVQAYGSEVQARISYSDSYTKASRARKEEGDARVNQLSATVSVASQELARANVAIAEINAIMSSYRLEIEGVSPYLQSAQTYISQAQGYGNEVQARLSVDGAHYGWYEKQQAKLQQDYDKGLKMLMGAG